MCDCVRMRSCTDVRAEVFFVLVVFLFFLPSFIPQEGVGAPSFPPTETQDHSFRSAS